MLVAFSVTPLGVGENVGEIVLSAMAWMWVLMSFRSLRNPSSPTGDSPSIPPPSNGTSPAGPPTPQAPGEADPPGKKAEDLCPDQDAGGCHEQGLRAWAAALAAELPPLTSSQAAAVARIAARLDARNGQEPAA
jgi:hypothetical protein